MGRQTLAAVEAKRDEADAWRVEWEDRSRETTLAGIAYMAEHDDEAEVVAL